MYRFKKKVIDKRGKVYRPGMIVPGDIPLFALAEMVRVGDVEKVDILADEPVITKEEIQPEEYAPVEPKLVKMRRTRKHKGDE
ncbi:MAG: hypothetical protein WC455_25720 [Dehalococcoidia bacterium]|jgi:hypothetical protein